jgi:hypothetical protein
MLLVDVIIALSLLSSFTTVYTANLECPNHTATPPYPVMVILKTAFSYLFDKKVQMPLACTCIPAQSTIYNMKAFKLCPIRHTVIVHTGNTDVDQHELSIHTYI